MKFAVLLSTFLVLTGTPLAAGQSATGTRVLLTPTTLHIERNMVPKEEVETLYQEILEAAVPGPRDRFHSGLLGIKGDAGAQVEQMVPKELVTKFRRIMSDDSREKESGILRVEHLKPKDHDKVKKLINDVIQNRVLDDKGTIHVYLSRPNSAALANHTDTTDIFVLQLSGAKEWLLCEDELTFHEKTSLRKKLDKCATYDAVEIANLVCQKETLYPGDALYLPKRVVHSARATDEGVSAHLTFGFSDNMCSKDAENRPDVSMPEKSWIPRFLQSSCDESCDTSCNGSCDAICTCSCDNGMISCDSCCNDSCDSYCDGSCDSSCDSGVPTPPSAPAPTPYAPAPTTSASSTGLSPGAIAGIVIGIVFVVLGAAVGAAVGIFVCKRKSEGTAESATPSSTPAVVVAPSPGEGGPTEFSATGAVEAAPQPVSEILLETIINPDGTQIKRSTKTTTFPDGHKEIEITNEGV